MSPRCVPWSHETFFTVGRCFFFCFLLSLWAPHYSLVAFSIRSRPIWQPKKSQNSPWPKSHKVCRNCYSLLKLSIGIDYDRDIVNMRLAGFMLVNMVLTVGMLYGVLKPNVISCGNCVAKKRANIVPENSIPMISFLIFCTCEALSLPPSFQTLIPPFLARHILGFLKSFSTGTSIYLFYFSLSLSVYVWSSV